MTKPLSTLIIGIALIGTTFQLMSVSAALSAGARSCRFTTYYKEAEMATIVGTRTNCPGGQSTGRTSPYFETEIVQLDTGGGAGGPATGPGRLPCEFLAKGCSNLPEQRFGG